MEFEGGFPLLRCCSEVLDQSGDSDLTIHKFLGLSSSSATVHVVRCIPVAIGSECATRAVPVKDIKAQLGAAREETERTDHAPVATHLDGI